MQNTWKHVSLATQDEVHGHERAKKHLLFDKEEEPAELWKWESSALASELKNPPGKLLVPAINSWLGNDKAIVLKPFED